MRVLCQKCGANNIRVIATPISCALDNEIGAANARTAILAGSEDAPAWVCVQCNPQWLEVNELALQEYGIGVQQEKAIEEQDFWEAARLRDIKLEIRRKREAEFAKLVSGEAQ